MLDTHHTVEVPEGIEINLPLAGPVERSLAFMLDMLIRIGIYIVMYSLLNLMGNLGLGLFLICYFLIEWFYPVFFEIFNQGATPGKKMMDLAVVNDDGTPVTWATSLTRNLLRSADQFPAFYLVGLISMFLNSEFKRLGDLAAGTLVIHKKTYVNKSKLPEKKPKHASIHLTIEEQSAILHFGERSNNLSEPRCHELADILQPVLGENSASQRMNAILSIANWLRGRR